MTSRYRTLVEALDDLNRRGFTVDFDLQVHCLVCNQPAMQLHPDDFEIVEVHRFEGASSPDDSDIVYAIEGKNGIKGVLVDAYGTYADSLSTEMLAKLRVHR